MAAIRHPLIEIDVVEELVDAQHIWEQFTRDQVIHGAHHRLQRVVAFPRNIDEMIRLIDALDFHNNHGDVCPAGWQKGDKGMNPSDDGMRKYIAKNAKTL